MKILIVVRDMLKVGKQDLLSHHFFVSEFEKHHDVIWWGPLRDGYDESRPITDVVNEHKPDILFKYGFRMPFEIDMDKVKIPKTIYLVDYFPAFKNYAGCKQQYYEYLKKVQFDVVFVPVTYMVNYVYRTRITSHPVIMPFSVNTDYFKKMDIKKTIDVSAMFIIRDDVYPNRRMVVEAISRMNIRSYLKKICMKDYLVTLNASRIFVTSNNIFGSLSMKYTECMSCGTFMLADKPEDLEEFGYKDGKHLVIYKDINDMKNKINYYLENEEEREKIAKKGMDFVRKNYSNKATVIRFTDYIKRRFDI
uniref:Putative glycosyltransferase n=1 Tax=viral metagenome TaxID=1070528 RepID=A0A6M3KJ62_9ZZZZ